jgi:hypothetical protein
VDVALYFYCFSVGLHAARLPSAVEEHLLEYPEDTRFAVLWLFIGLLLVALWPIVYLMFICGWLYDRYK